jgi:hypothetical protein
MVSGVGAAPLNVIVLILLFVPGIIGMDLYYFTAQKRNPLTRSRRLIYSTAISAVSLLILYVVSPVYFDAGSMIIGRTAARLNIVTQEELANLVLPVGTVFYISHAALAGLGGALAGRTIRTVSSSDSDPREPWHYAFEQSGSDERIEVLLTDDRIIHETFDQAAWDSSQRELFLNDPEQVTYNSDGTNIESRNSLGRSLLIMGDSISQVVFLEQDPESDPPVRSSTEDREEARDSLAQLEMVLDAVEFQNDLYSSSGSSAEEDDTTQSTEENSKEICEANDADQETENDDTSGRTN